MRAFVTEIEADGGARPIVNEQDFVAVDGSQKIADLFWRPLSRRYSNWNNAGGSWPMDIDAPEGEFVEGMTLNF